jgi:type II secretory pathway pseudopilin PulG
MTKGFSLVELIVIVGLTSILAIVITSVSMANLLSSARVRNLVKARQAGDTAINQLQTNIRNARTIISCDSTSETLNIENTDGTTTTYSLQSGHIATNDDALTPTDQTVTLFDITCSPDDITPTLVTIKFSITNSQTSARVGETPILPYETTIQIRN